MKTSQCIAFVLGVTTPGWVHANDRGPEAEPATQFEAEASGEQPAVPGSGDDEVASPEASESTDSSAAEPEPDPDASKASKGPPVDLLDDSSPSAEDPLPRAAPPAISIDEQEQRPKPLGSTAVRGGVRVELVPTDGRQLELFRVDPQAGNEAVGQIDGIPFVRVCKSPCSEPIDAREGDEFFVAGPDLMPSRRFYLDEYDDELRLDVRPGPKPIRFAGFGLTVAGALLIPAGILMSVAAPWGKAGDAAGYASIGVGGASIVGGIVLLLRGRTKVELSESSRTP